MEEAISGIVSDVTSTIAALIIPAVLVTLALVLIGLLGSAFGATKGLSELILGAGMVLMIVLLLLLVVGMMGIVASWSYEILQATFGIFALSASVASVLGLILAWAAGRAFIVILES